MVIAITGKCCSGKNYITNIISKENFIVLDVDVISHSVFKDSEDRIIEHFGSSILTLGKIDRKKLGNVVFSDNKKREELEGIIHPGVYREIYKVIDSDKKRDYLINIPLLTNSELIDRCDNIIWIKSPLILRIYRALKRDNYHIITVIKRIISQRKLSVKHFKSSVDISIIRNSFSSKVLNRDISLLLNRLKRGLNGR